MYFFMQVGPQLLSNDQNVVFGPINHSASMTSSMQVESPLLSNQNLVFDPMNNSAPCTSSMVGPQLLSNQNLVFDPINHYAPIASSMQVESQPLSNQNLVSDYSRNYLVPNTSSMVGHDQLLSNNNFFSDPRNHFAPNTCLMVHPQVAELFAQFTALLGRYLLNQSLVSAPQWQINPQQGSYSSLYSNGDFGNNCTSSSSEFHRGLEDAWIAQGSFQDKHPEEATGQDFSY
ncbi:uncharacterized protein LOC116136182 isoform X1 [Pistacia vera]|uniref:uncharacterized protein LOC116136182 isoform X1 n=1 Tax=Pistacia vera TaxID=55513 RepID=UPI0012631B67|nr:uncharacterized protein LOC116136182 isoform X1 [Pistacia vera]